MEEPKKFSRKVRREELSSPFALFLKQDWEDTIKSEEGASIIYRRIQKFLEKEFGIDIRKNIKLLEIGTGNAVLLDYMKKQGVDAVGVDVRDEPMGEHTSSQVIARIEQLPFPNETFNIVLSNAVFDTSSYNQDQDTMMKEILRVLKTGGLWLGGEFINKPGPIEGFTVISNTQLPIVYKKS